MRRGVRVFGLARGTLLLRHRIGVVPKQYSSTKQKPANPFPQSSSTPRYQPLYDFRRLKERSLYPKTNFNPHPDDVVVFPREGVDRNYEVNRSLSWYAIAPKDLIYCNTHERGLLNVARGKQDENKALVYEGNEQSPRYNLPAEGEEKFSGEHISFDNYKELFREIRQTLSNSSPLFINDGLVGSHRSIGLKTRVFGNEPNFALFAKRFLEPVPRHLPDTFKDWDEDIKVFLTPNLHVHDQYGIVGGSFTVVNFRHGHILAGGAVSTESLREALSSLAGYQLVKKHPGAVVLSGHCIVTDDGQTVVIGGSDEITPFLREKVFSAHDTIWTDEGVFGMWRGLSYTANGNYGDSVQKGDLVAKYKVGKKSFANVSTTALPNRGSVAQRPAAVVLLEQGKSAKGLQEATAKDVGAIVSRSGYDPAVSSANFGALVDAHKPKIFKATLAGSLTDKKVETLLADIFKSVAK
eukprot:TRINITY_DN16717_c0_g1_i1.p1 TRINITY_DN16717_c0_g1~~TRINITY_DN16717_c0_g1_i1.p1  ORF type:complete len:466 (-),score=58.74 TRINITY_DN16717_c0_g1_i1:13-1410(-)